MIAGEFCGNTATGAPLLEGVISVMTVDPLLDELDEDGDVVVFFLRF